jgi:Cof subfamily protein (haloacid dehalogenase superfamily)
MKLIASDYDGTLRFAEKMEQRDLEAIERWRKNGNLFVIDTGRSMESIQMEADKNGLKADYFITNNGGMVYDADQNVMASSHMDPDLAREIMDYAHTQEHMVCFVANDGYYRHRIMIHPDLEEKRYLTLEPDLTEEELRQTGKYAQIVLSFDDTEAASAAAEYITDTYPELICYANRYVADVVRRDVSKANGLKMLMEKIGIGINDVYTFGDADNDIPLIRFGVHGACVSSALPHVKENARIVCEHIAELIELIEHSEI